MTKKAPLLQAFWELWIDILQSLSFQRLSFALSHSISYVCFAFGLCGLFFTPQTLAPSFLRLCFAAFVEEITWRALIQNQLENSLNKKLWGMSYANYISSCAFACLHIFTQNVFFALLTFFPSLVMGYLWTRFQSTWLCTFIHLWYNLIFWGMVY